MGLEEKVFPVLQDSNMINHMKSNPKSARFRHKSSHKRMEPFCYNEALRKSRG